MQKVLRRTVLAKRQVARRKLARAGKNDSDNRQLRKLEQTEYNKSIRQSVVASRTVRREDWFLGPLAPKRDAGDAKDTYGTVDVRLTRGVEKAKGDYKNWGIVEGDRVVVVQNGHRDIGKIGEVKELREKSEEVVVAGLNRADVEIPEYLLANEQDKTPYRTLELPLPLSAVRLVAPLPHPETGVVRDVIINEIMLRKTTIREMKGEDEPSRFIAGLRPLTRIPYPVEEPETFEDHDEDTLRIEVEQRTWIPTLLTPPMPPSIIDELRNKYSKFRDRHDSDYIARKIKEDEENLERTKLSKQMMTPLKELHRKERMEKKARGKPVLSEEMMARIGEVMAKNRPSGATERATLA